MHTHQRVSMTAQVQVEAPLLYIKQQVHTENDSDSLNRDSGSMNSACTIVISVCAHATAQVQVLSAPLLYIKQILQTKIGSKVNEQCMHKHQ